MINKILLFLFFIFNLGSLTAQIFTGKLNPFPNSQIHNLNNKDTLKILAVLVDFQPDNDNATFGDGTFGTIYTQDYGKSILDPLPHDVQYFENHLLFVKNYFEKVSNENQIITFHVIESVLTVSQIMRNYSPPFDDENNFSPLVEFCQEVWNLAEQDFSEFDFSKFDCFVIFHAGVGRDVSFPGMLGNERDLQSIYFSLNSFKKILGPDFSGFPVNNNNYRITNSMIIPETESRELSGLGQTVLWELSINGLIAASIGSHLGLPDLFDTETGLSAIGKFGLMDGQAIFAYSGLFPPEPSPWEKIYLGWVEPINITGGNIKVNLVAERASNIADTTLLKVAINSSEYFLIENRSRDAHNDGCIVTYMLDDQLLTKTIIHDTESFNSINVDTIDGVVIDIDEFDWAVPRYDRNSTLESFEDVGIVIWHIDESIIDANILDNKINTDKFLRGVRVVEADGIYDIGEQFQTIFGDEVVGEGSKEDTWYKGNPSELYRNIFNDESKPNSNSNTSANSLINISNFSQISLNMSFDLEFKDDIMEQVSNFEISNGGQSFSWLNYTENDDDLVFFASNETGYVKFDLDGNVIVQGNVKIQFHPALINTNSRDFLISANTNSVIIESVSGNSRVSLSKFDSAKISSPPVVYNIDDESVRISFGTESGYIHTYQLKTTIPLSLNQIKAQKILDEPVKQIATDGNFMLAISNNYYWDEGDAQIFIPSLTNKLVLTKNSAGDYVSIVLNNENNFFIIKDGQIDSKFNIKATEHLYTFSVADLKGDGNNYILVNTGNNLDAYNFVGSSAVNFPVEIDNNTELEICPLTIDLIDDNASEIITFATNGNIISLSGDSGDLIYPFPVSSGSKNLVPPILCINQDQVTIASINEDNFFYAWDLIQFKNNLIWTSEFADQQNTSFVGQPTGINIENEFFPKSKAYNWPNPVYGDQTHIRFYVSENSNVVIKIFDLAGDLVDELKGSVPAGIDSEFTWNVNNIESGVYFANIRVKGSSGKSDSKIIKIAVIK
ncbi:T9SS type A sorting domain-containing protein [Bacteroidota bacterium]